jgi:putative transposase
MEQIYYPPLFPNQYYHIYNRGNNRENLFLSEENYHFFLRKYDYYLSDYLDTYAYCLLPNHFHLLVKIKSQEMFQFSKFLKLGKPLEDPSEIVSEAFRRFFMSYSKAINKQSARTGSLFQKNFKRKMVEHDAYLLTCARYIHQNPQKHGICDDFKTYQYSSYGRILIEKPTKLMKREVINWFGNNDSYKQLHNSFNIDSNIAEKIIIE